MSIRPISARLLLALIAAAFLFWSLCQPAQAGGEDELAQGFFTMVTEGGEAIFETAHTLTVGDELIAENNAHYRVTRVVGRKAFAQRVGVADLATAAEEVAAQISPSGGWGVFRRTRGVIGIYQTHSDESYRPTSGTPSKNWGDIYQVGKALKEELEAKGYRVVWNRDNFAPHDGGAYHRSRRAVAQLLQEKPLALLDIHRDAGVPVTRYLTRVGGEKTARVTLVVGRQNANHWSNLSFAKALKHQADREKPGLVKGILIAQGNYNQDLGPRTLLLEFGTDTNRLEEAERGARAIADVFPAVLTSTGRPRGATQQGRETTTGAGSAALLIVGALVLVGVFLLLNTGGWAALKRGLARFSGREFANFLTLRGRREKGTSKGKGQEEVEEGEGKGKAPGEV